MKKRSFILILLILSIFTLCLSSCKKEEDTVVTEDLRTMVHVTKEKLDGKRVGIMIGTPQEDYVSAALDNPELIIYENNIDECLAMENNKIDTCICVDDIFDCMAPDFPSLVKSDFVFINFQAGFIFQKNEYGQSIQSKFNTYLAEIKENGTLEQLQKDWVTAESKEAVEIPSSGVNGTLKCGMNSAIKPYIYKVSGGYTGFDVIVLKGFLDKYGYGATFEDTNYAGMVAGIISNKYDLSFGVLARTEKREEVVLFSDSYYEYDMVAVVRRNDYSIQDNSVLYLDKEVLNGKTGGILTGTPQDKIVYDNFDNAEVQYFTTNTDCFIAVRENKIDFTINNTIQFELISDEYPDFAYINDTLLIYDNGAIFPKTEKGAKLRDQYNEYLKKITDNGTLKEIEDYWLHPRDWEPIDIPTSGVNGVINMATSTTMKPFTMRIGSKYGGYDIDIVARFCKEYGYGLTIEDGDFSSVVAGISTNKYDIGAGQIAWTAERAESVYYSDFNAHQYVVAYVRVADFINDDSKVVPTETFFESFATGFKKTFVDEDRWQVILSGLGITMIISICGFILANIFGGIFCALAMSKKKVLRVISDIYSRIMQGTPIVVILMILYYIVFGNSNLSGVIISIIGFGLSIGAYLSQIFYGNIKGIDKGQNEAALTLGFTKVGSFTHIILPQAIRTMLPAYFSQFISLMKGTAIVGYIAVLDLTRASDIIRSNTYRAFFPLISTALIYFIISCILLSILKFIQNKLAPKRRVNQEVGGDK